MTLAVKLNLIVHQMDVVTTFLNGEVEEELYMGVMEGFTVALEGIVKRNVNPHVTAVAKNWIGHFKLE